VDAESVQLAAMFMRMQKVLGQEMRPSGRAERQTQRTDVHPKPTTNTAGNIGHHP